MKLTVCLALSAFTFMSFFPSVSAYDSVTTDKVISLVDKKAQPSILRLDLDGNPWVLNTTISAIQLISNEGKPFKTLLPSKKKDGSFRAVSDFVFCRDGSLLVADPDSNRIAHLDKDHKFLQAINVPSPSAVAVSHDDVIAVGLTNEGLVRILSIDGITLHDLFLPGKEAFKSITALAFAMDGNLWILDGKAGKLHRFSPQRKWLGATDNLMDATALTVDKYGFAYVTIERGQWKEIDPNGKLTGSFGTKGKERGKMSGPAGIAMTAQNQLWVCETENKRLQLFSISNPGKETVLLSEPAIRLQARKGATWPIQAKAAFRQKSGETVVLNAKKPKIDWLDKNGAVKSSLAKKELAKVVDVTQDPADAVWVLDAGDHQIKKISPEGDIQKAVGQKGKKEGGLNDPSFLRIRPDGSFVVIDKGRSRIQVLSPDGLFLFSPGKNGVKAGEYKTVTGLAASANRIAVVDNERKALVYYDKNGKFLLEVANAEGKAPVWKELTDVVVDGAGRFYVMDKGTGRLRIFSEDGKFIADFSSSGDRLGGGSDKTILVLSEKSITSYTLDFLPPVLANLTAVDDAGDIKVSWDRDVDAVFYHVYRATTSNSYVMHLSTPNNAFTDRDTVPGLFYRYAVRGVNQMNYEGNWSQSAPVKASRRRDVALVSISNVSFQPVFTAAFKFYVKEPIGNIEVVNNSDLLYRNVKLSLGLKRYTDYPTEKIIQDLEPGQKLTVPVTLTFNNSVLELTEDTPVQVDIRLSYFEDNVEKTVSQNAPLSLYSRNAISWNEKSRIASFITPKDVPIVEFSRQAIRAFLPPLKTTTLMKPMAKTVLFFESLKALNISYVKDPKTPYTEASKNPTILDYVQFPRETLRRKTGDCDDTTALFSSLLESIGVETALVDTPGHIFVMVNVEENDPAAIGLPIERFVEYRNSYWIPIETTKLNGSFKDAWQTAATEVKRAQEREQIEYVTFASAGDKYAPVTLVENDPNQPAFPEAAVAATFPKILADLEAERYANRVKAIQEKMAKDPKDSKLKIHLGMIYVEGRNLEEAEALFKSLQQDEWVEIQAAAHNNLGNIAYIKGNFEEAAKSYGAAANLDPKDGGIIMNRARTAWKLQNKPDVEKYLAEARELLPDWREYATDFPAELVSR